MQRGDEGSDSEDEGMDARRNRRDHKEQEDDVVAELHGLDSRKSKRRTPGIMEPMLRAEAQGKEGRKISLSPTPRPPYAVPQDETQRVDAPESNGTAVPAQVAPAPASALAPAHAPTSAQADTDLDHATPASVAAPDASTLSTSEGANGALSGGKRDDAALSAVAVAVAVGDGDGDGDVEMKKA